MKSLSVWTVLKESTVFTVANWKIFGKLFLIPIIVQFGASIFINSIKQVNVDNPLVIVPLLISVIIIYLAFSIAAPRWIQHYCKPKSTVSFFQFHKVEWRFFTYLIAVFGIVFGLTVLGIIVSELVLFSMGSSISFSEGFTLPQILATATTIMVTLGLCLTIWARLWFVSPAVALSKPTGLRQAWKESRPHWKKLMGLVLLIEPCLRPLSLIEEKGPLPTFIGVLITTVISAIGGICVTKFYLAPKR